MPNNTNAKSENDNIVNYILENIGTFIEMIQSQEVKDAGVIITLIPGARGIDRFLAQFGISPADKSLIRKDAMNYQTQRYLDGDMTSEEGYQWVQNSSRTGKVNLGTTPGPGKVTPVSQPRTPVTYPPRQPAPRYSTPNLDLLERKQSKAYQARMKLLSSRAEGRTYKDVEHDAPTDLMKTGVPKRELQPWQKISQARLDPTGGTTLDQGGDNE